MDELLTMSKKELSRLEVIQRVEQKRLSQKEAAEILMPLRQLAHDVRENEVLADRMVVNAAFLVEKAREPEFDQTTTGLDERFGKRVAFKYVGPVPPYNFVNIVVNWRELR